MPTGAAKTSMDSIWWNYVGKEDRGAYSNNAEAAAQSYSVFRAAYAGLAAKKGILDGSFDNATAREAARIATGGVGDVYGKKTLLPWGHTAGNVRNAIKLGWPATVKAYGLQGQPDDYTYTLVAPNVYQVMVGNAPKIALYKGKPTPVLIRVKPQSDAGE